MSASLEPLVWGIILYTEYGVQSTKISASTEYVETIVVDKLGLSMEQIILGHANWAHGLDS